MMSWQIFQDFDSRLMGMAKEVEELVCGADLVEWH